LKKSNNFLEELIAVDTIIKNFVDTEKERWRKAIRRSMRTVANKVKADFVAQAKICMDAYYQEYDPISYIRTENLKDHAIRPYERAREGELDVGVAFSSDFMNPYRVGPQNQLDGYEVADLVVNNFMEGIHGSPSVYIGRHVDETMQHFTTAYNTWALDKYFSDINFKKYMN
jgi:hypothetical protein